MMAATRMKRVGDYSRQVGAKIRLIRIHQGLTSAELASRVAPYLGPERPIHDRQWLLRAENGVRSLSPDEIWGLSRALGVSADQIVSPDPVVVATRDALPDA